MFRQLRKENEIPVDGVISVTVGAASKMTSAKWHVPEPLNVIDMIATLAGVDVLTKI